MCAQLCGVASCHATTRHPKSDGHAISFEPPSLTVFCLTVRFLCDGCSWIQKHHQQNIVSVPNTVAISFLPWNVSLNFHCFGEPLCTEPWTVYWLRHCCRKSRSHHQSQTDPGNSPLCCFTAEGSLVLTLCAAIFVYPLTFWATIFRSL